MTVTAEPITAGDKAWAEKIARLKARKPIERTVTLFDEELEGAAQEAFEELGRVTAAARVRADQKHRGEQDEKKRAKLVENTIARDRLVVQATKAHEAAADAAVSSRDLLTFRGLGGNLFEELKEKYPPTDAQAEEGMVDYNPDTFPAALIAASCTEPMTPEDAEELLEALNSGEANLLFSTAVFVNTRARAQVGKE